MTARVEAAKGGYGVVAELPLEGGASPDARTRAGWTPLLWTSERGHAEVVALLVGAGAMGTSWGERGAAPVGALGKAESVRPRVADVAGSGDLGVACSCVDRHGVQRGARRPAEFGGGPRSEAGAGWRE